MDFMFDDEAEEVGSDTDSYCPKCKLDTSHTVITKYEEEVRRVQCAVCGDVHTYRKPRGEGDDEGGEPVAARKRAMLKKPSWSEAKDRAGNKGIAHARPYSIRDSYSEGDVVTHPKFGLGFVTEITENKVEITFEDERRLLIHNRADLASQMPAIAAVPAPREEKPGRGKKGKGKAAAAPPPPPPAPAKAAAPAKGGKAAKAEPEAAPPPKAEKPAKGAKAAPPLPPAKAEKAPPTKAAPAKAAAKPAAKPAVPAKAPAKAAPAKPAPKAAAKAKPAAPVKAAKPAPAKGKPVKKPGKK